MTGAELLERRPWRSVAVPSDVLSVPTMLAEEELALLYTLARDYATSGGAIVDAGCFLGGSSAALLAGLRDRPAPWQGVALESYDLFRVEEYTLNEFFARNGDLKVGSSFRRLYDRNVAAFDVPHVVREGDITMQGWTGDPIDVLFLDVLKTPAVSDAVLRDFFPHVVPGRTVIVHQDYEWGHVPWLHITVELMRNSLRWIDAVPHCSHVFLVEEPIPQSLLRMSVWRDTGDDEKVWLIDQAIDHNIGDARGMVELSKAVLLALIGRPRQATALLNSVDQRYDSVAVADCAAQIRRNLGLSDAASPLPDEVVSSRTTSAEGVNTVRSGYTDWDAPDVDLAVSSEASEQDAREVTAIVEEYIHAIASGNSTRAAASLSRGLRRRLRNVSDGEDDGGKRLSTLIEQLDQGQRSAVATIEVTRVLIQGSYAFVVCQAPGAEQTILPAHRDGDGWKVAAIHGRTWGGS